MFSRKDNDTYKATTWQINFTIEQDQLAQGSSYKLRIALAAAKDSNLEVIKKSKNRNQCLSFHVIWW